MIKENIKKRFRKDSLILLKRVSNLPTYKIEKTILAHLYQIIQSQKSHNIMLYLPLKLEVNLYPLILQLRKEKKNLFVPFMELSSFRLVEYRLPLKTKKFGIKEPNYSNKYRVKNIDLAIVPIIGIDKTYRRIGFGKGIYDRFFEKENKNIKETIFVTKRLCYSHIEITNDYDISPDIIVSP
jgi:5-formyltetrahydrofolate cyclo-ligase